MQVVAGEESDVSGSSLHKFTVVLVVLGCLGLVLLIITVVLVILRCCSASKSSIRRFVITEKAPTRSLNVKLGPRRN